MAQNALSILLQTNTSLKDTLKEEWGYVIDNYMKTTISGMFKNTDLSGEPTAGVLQAKRFANATNKAYGTARAAHGAEKVKAKPVTVEIDDDQEWLEEVEEKDLQMYGVDGIVSRRTQNQKGAISRYFERKFFNEGYLAGEVFALSGSTIEDKLESLIQKLEVVKNDFVDGIIRDDMVLVLDPATYGLIRTKLDTFPVANVNTSLENFTAYHGVLTFSSIYLPDTVNALIMRKESIAQPIRLNTYGPAPIEFSDATSFGAFTYAGTKAVTPDLIFFAGTIGTATLTTVYGGSSNTTKITPTSTLSDSDNSFWYKAHATAVAAPTYGDDAEDAGYTKMELTSGAQTLTVATQTKIRVAEVDASGRIIKISAETSIVKTNG